MKKRFVAAAALSILALLFVYVPSHADTYLKCVRHTGEFTVMGQTQPAKDEAVVTWMGKDRARVDLAEGSSVIVVPSKKILYLLDHAEKTYTEAPMDFKGAIDRAIESEAGDDEDAKAVAEQIKGLTGAMMQFKASVTETTETKKIKGWNCRKYIIELSMPMGKSTAEAWATEDLEIDAELFRIATNAMMAENEGFAEVMKEMKKIKGMIVRQESTSLVMGAEVESIDEIVEVSEKAAPAGIYDIPKDYGKVE